VRDHGRVLNRLFEVSKVALFKCNHNEKVVRKWRGVLKMKNKHEGRDLSF